MHTIYIIHKLSKRLPNYNISLHKLLQYCSVIDNWTKKYLEVRLLFRGNIQPLSYCVTKRKSIVITKLHNNNTTTKTAVKRKAGTSNSPGF